MCLTIEIWALPGKAISAINLTVEFANSLWVDGAKSSDQSRQLRENEEAYFKRCSSCFAPPLEQHFDIGSDSSGNIYAAKLESIVLRIQRLWRAFRFRCTSGNGCDIPCNRSFLKMQAHPEVANPTTFNKRGELSYLEIVLKNYEAAVAKW